MTDRCSMHCGCCMDWRCWKHVEWDMRLDAVVVAVVDRGNFDERHVRRMRPLVQSRMDNTHSLME